MTEAMQKIAGGDKTVAIPALERGDEVGGHGQDAGSVQGKPDRGRSLRVEQEAQKEHKLALRKMADAFEVQVGTVVEAVTAAAIQLQASSKQMASTTTECLSEKFIARTLCAASGGSWPVG